MSSIESGERVIRRKEKVKKWIYFQILVISAISLLFVHQFQFESFLGTRVEATFKSSSDVLFVPFLREVRERTCLYEYEYKIDELVCSIKVETKEVCANDKNDNIIIDIFAPILTFMNPCNPFRVVIANSVLLVFWMVGFIAGAAILCCTINYYFVLEHREREEREERKYAEIEEKKIARRRERGERRKKKKALKDKENEDTKE